MGTQILTALLVGLLTAFAFQLLLTSLGIAIGVTALGFRFFSPAEAEIDLLESELESEVDLAVESEPKSTNAPMGFLAGLGLLLTINSVLFIACFLATKFSQIQGLLSGAIAGIIIWSAYFLILTWISSAAVSSLIGIVAGAITGGFRRLVAPLLAVFQEPEETPLTEETAIAIIRQEVQKAFSGIDLDQFNAPFPVPSASTSIADQDLQLNPQAIAFLLEQVDDLPGFLQTHTPLDQAEIEQTVEQLQELQEIGESPLGESANSLEGLTGVWEKFTAYLRYTNAKHLTPDQVQGKLEQLITEAEENSGLQLSVAVEQVPEQVFEQIATVKGLLKRRKGLEKKRRRQILQRVESTWQHILQTRAAEVPPEAVDDDGADAKAPIDLGAIREQLPQWLTVSSVLAWSLQQQLKRVDWEQVRDRLSLPDLEEISLEQLSLEQLTQVPQRWGESHVVPQIEAVKAQVMERIDQLQGQIQQRIEGVKLQTQQRLEDTRRAAMVAAWWLFATASTAAISAAIAGGLATQVPDLY